ncbi:chloride channel protein [Nocardia colli]|uniref:chloride channel protein n=1 Tax=Nocardia colli TaxID=2545717 RepID=UPI0035DF63D2
MASLLMIAVAAGLGAIVLTAMLRATTSILLALAVPEGPGRTGGDLGPAVSTGWIHMEHPWLLPIVVAAGMGGAAALSLLETAQSVAGTDGLIAALDRRDLTGLHVRGAAIKVGGTALTLGGGGSGGTEGPMAQVAASLAASVVRKLRLSPEESRMWVITGLAAGVGALFQAPWGGAVLGAELLRRRGVEWRLLARTIPAAHIAHWVYMAVYGPGPFLGHVPIALVPQLSDSFAIAAVGVCCGLIARLYIGATLVVHTRLTASRQQRPLLTATLAGAAIGFAGICIPTTLGTGYSTIEAALSTSAVLAVPLWTLAVLPVVKTAATALTLGSGGVGGYFGPAMVIGAAVGALGWRLTVQFGMHPGPVAAFIMAGVAACLGPAVGCPLAAIVMCTEATGNSFPHTGMLLAVGISALVLGNRTLFPSQNASPRHAR